jgi:hypothetical protein
MLNTNITLDTVGIQAMELLQGFNVRLAFTDGTQREIDLEPYLRGPIFEPIKSDPEMFQRVFIDPEWHCLAWPNGADIDPDALYYEGPPPWAETNPDGSPLLDDSSAK